MQTAEDANTASTTAVTSLSYFDTLISGATEKGLFQIIVEGKYMTPDIINTLSLGYGYAVYELNDGLSTYNRYVIDWTNPSVGPK